MSFKMTWFLQVRIQGFPEKKWEENLWRQLSKGMWREDKMSIDKAQG